MRRWAVFCAALLLAGCITPPPITVTPVPSSGCEWGSAFYPSTTTTKVLGWAEYGFDQKTIESPKFQAILLDPETPAEVVDALTTFSHPNADVASDTKHLTDSNVIYERICNPAAPPPP